MHNKVVKNASWIIGVKIVQALLAFVISSLTARYLGPSNYGVIGYAQSIIAFVTPIMQLGLTAVLVQELVQNPNDEGKILGTAQAMSIVSAVLCILGVLGFTCLTNVGEKETFIVCALYSLVLICQSFEMLQYWFQAKYLSKYSSVVMLIAYIVVAGYRTVLLIFQKDVYWFAVSYAIDYCLIAVGLHIVYHKLGGQRLRFSKTLAKRLFSRSKYYIVSGLMVTVFAQTDRVMLKLMIGDAETGFYTAAVTCAGLTGFVFAAVIDSMRPLIVESKAISREKYETNLIRLYSLVLYGAFFYSLFVAVFAPFIIGIIYGAAYTPAINVLRILVWYTAFSYFGSAKNIWMLVENNQKYLLVLNAGGALANVILNLILIPYFGAVGAAVASLVTQICTNVVFGFFIKRLRPNNRLLFRALNPCALGSMLRGVRTKS